MSPEYGIQDASEARKSDCPQTQNRGTEKSKKKTEPMLDASFPGHRYLKRQREEPVLLGPPCLPRRLHAQSSRIMAGFLLFHPYRRPPTQRESPPSRGTRQEAPSCLKLRWIDLHLLLPHSSILPSLALHPPFFILILICPLCYLACRFEVMTRRGASFSSLYTH